MYIVHCVTICPYSVDLVLGEIFIEYANEAFPFLLGRKGTFDREGVYLSVI